MQDFEVESHVAPGEQSSVVPQLVLHRPSVPQRYGAQGVVEPSLLTEVVRSELQTALLPEGTHLLAVQVNPSAQSLAAAQSRRQPALVQPYGAHAFAPGALQAPVPSQVETSVNVAAMQVAPPHVVSGPTNAPQLVAFLPSQVLAEHAPDVPASHLVRVPWGAPMIAVHVPNVPA
jgi:hypothetical protein